MVKRCRICGAQPTVRAHLFPRALSSDIRAGAKHVVAIMPGAPRPKFHQSGEWSDEILCREHEDVAHDWEEYAIEFSRRYRAFAPPPGANLSVSVANPDPVALTMFAHIVVWRHAAAYSHIARGLGPYFLRIQDAIFSGKPPLEVVLIDPGHTKDGARARLAICPSPGRLAGRRIFRFDIGGLGFILRTTNKPFEWPFDEGFSASLNPLVVIQKDPLDIGQNKSIRKSVQQGRLTPER
jgi:hypothetical protein